MPEPTSQCPAEPTRVPQPNQILAQPATVQACQQAYAAAADVRATLAAQEARQR